MTNKKTTAKPAPKPAVNPKGPAKATVILAGLNDQHFEVVKDHVRSAVPGIRPTNADILAHALHLAAQSLKPVT